MEDIIVAVVLIAVSLLVFVLSIRSFLEKGFLLNNAYLYASKKQREEMDKTPYYRQSAVVFFMIGIVFLLIAAAILLDNFRVTYIADAVIVLLLIYAIASSIAIEKRKKRP
jgi:hypothetical protein